MSEPSLRRANEDDLDSLAHFIAVRNADPRSRCLMLPVIEEDIRGDMAEFNEEAHVHFVVAEESGELVGTAACDWDRDQGRGWIIGPYTAAPHQDLRSPLFDALEGILPEGVTWLDSFTDIANEEMYAFYLERGFSLYKRSQIYTAKRDVAEIGSKSPELLRDALRDQFLDLHKISFPTAPESGAKLLEKRGGQTPLFAMAEGAKLLGYLAAHLNDAPREGYVNYLAVAPEEQGKGYGRQLLKSALHWFFEDMDMPQATLVVEDANAGARHLYESSGFQLKYEGVSTRRGGPEA
jgi:ribosomal protein S18 acetylase RimI-like enzyme